MTELDAVDLCFEDSPLVGDRLLARHRVEVPALLPPRLSARAAEIARRNWEDRTRAEYIGVMVARRFHGLLVDLNAPLDLQELAVAILSHEQRHTSLCFAAARSLGFQGEIAFELAELQQARTPAGPAADCFEMVAATFGLGEVTALALIGHTLGAVPKSGYREVLLRIARDEGLHARLGPALLAAARRGETAAWLPWPGDARVRALLRRHRAALAARAVVEPDDVEALRDPALAAELAAVAVPPAEAFRAAYHRGLTEVVPALWRRFGLADLLD